MNVLCRKTGFPFSAKTKAAVNWQMPAFESFSAEWIF
jgi:hypothetical protein